MQPLASTLLLGPDDEAGRLWRGAQEAEPTAGSSLVSLCEAPDLGVRAAYRNCLFRYRPPIRLEPGEVVRSFPALTRLVDRMMEAGRSPAGRGG